MSSTHNTHKQHPRCTSEVYAIYQTAYCGGSGWQVIPTHQWQCLKKKKTTLTCLCNSPNQFLMKTLASKNQGDFQAVADTTDSMMRCLKNTLGPLLQSLVQSLLQTSFQSLLHQRWSMFLMPQQPAFQSCSAVRQCPLVAYPLHQTKTTFQSCSAVRRCPLVAYPLHQTKTTFQSCSAVRRCPLVAYPLHQMKTTFQSSFQLHHQDHNRRLLPQRTTPLQHPLMTFPFPQKKPRLRTHLRMITNPRVSLSMGWPTWARILHCWNPARRKERGGRGFIHPGLLSMNPARLREGLTWLQKIQTKCCCYVDPSSGMRCETFARGSDCFCNFHMWVFKGNNCRAPLPCLLCRDAYVMTEKQACCICLQRLSLEMEERYAEILNFFPDDNSLGGGLNAFISRSTDSILSEQDLNGEDNFWTELEKAEQRAHVIVKQIMEDQDPQPKAKKKATPVSCGNLLDYQSPWFLTIVFNVLISFDYEQFFLIIKN